ncbi:MULTISPECIES: hypothetical protein [unclassified Streptomyces]|uniref:hypothetical protein n=1 Tax=unclassified Streptomyces TaxID=2593676 RepID=UPI00332CEC31
MNRASRAARLAVPLVLAGASLTACGIQETGVVQAGRPAVGDLLPPREARVLLFLLTADDELLPVPRTVDAPWHTGDPGVVGPDGSPARPDGATGEDRPGGSPSPGAEASGPLSPLMAVNALLTGPNKAEQRAGLRNAPSLPRATSAVDRVSAGGSTVEVGLNLRVRSLTAPARDQLVCTAAYAAHAQGALPVSLVGQDGRLAPADCSLRPAPAPAR